MMAEVCDRCGELTSEFDYYQTLDGEYIFCSKECCEEFYEEHNEYDTFENEILCPAYYDCEKFDNIRNMCIHTSKLRFGLAKLNLENSVVTNSVEWCSPADVTIIRSNIKLFDFVKKTEEESSKLNQETLKLTRINTLLAVAMLITSVINLIIIL